MRCGSTASESSEPSRDQRACDVRWSRRRSSIARASFLDGVAEPGEPRILAGDLNLSQPAVPGYANGGAGIDHSSSPARRRRR